MDADFAAKCQASARIGGAGRGRAYLLFDDMHFIVVLPLA